MLFFFFFPCGQTLSVFVNSPGNVEESADTVFHAICLHRPLLLCSLADTGRGMPQGSLITGEKRKIRKFNLLGLQDNILMVLPITSKFPRVEAT